MSTITKQIVRILHSKNPDLDYHYFAEAVCEAVVTATLAEIALAYRYYVELGAN